ncbi:AAAD deacetylase, partial [Polyodon spathula]|nr:AAAD deacetylase [Polyodon spathula]
MGSKGILLILAGVLVAYYVYSPIPYDIEERWKLMVTDSFFRSLSNLAEVSELLGLKHYMGVMMFLTVAEEVVPASDDNVKVTDALFYDVPVVVYEPKRKTNGELNRAVIFIHGGGWCLGSARMGPYDLLSRRTAKELNAVVVSVDYRLAPAYHFPVQFDDVYNVVKYIVQDHVLSQYSVDVNRIAVSGDSAGGNLAAAVAQQLQEDPEIQVVLKAQVLLYPALQALDMNTPSYQQNEYMPILPKTLMVRFWSEYFTSDLFLFHAMMSNSHNSLESAHLLKFVNWTVFLPEIFRLKYNYTMPRIKSSDPSETISSITDPRASPLLVDDVKLQVLPKAYILTCEYDVLRDDGVMYATRLRRAGVQVTLEHFKDGFHGAMMLTIWPTSFEVGHRMVNSYIKWLDNNL